MYLAERLPGRDAGYAYRFLGFDFDAHATASDLAARRELVLDDVAALVDLLSQVGIQHVVCRSSSSGGYHVWIAMAEPLAPALADAIGHALNASLTDTWEPLLTTLDRGMLSNPATGCLRPPLSPHRDGSRSELAAGTLTTLLEPSTTVQDVQALLTAIRARHTYRPAPALVPGSGNLTSDRANVPTRPTQTYGVLPIDSDGHPHLPGAKRPLPAAAAAALRTPVQLTDDASAILGRILCGAARARWHYADIAALIATAPGLERLRTMRHRDRRVPRPTTGWDSPASVLRSDWAACVRYTASTPTVSGSGDDTYDTRRENITRLVENIMARVGATPGRWSRRGGATERRVLTQLAVYALASTRADVEADTRRLALDTGVAKSTVWEALQRLQADGWIAQAGAAGGQHGTRWTIDPKHLQNELSTDSNLHRTQGALRPPRARPLLEELRAFNSLAAHDLFTPRGLGYHAGNLYAQLHQDHTLPATLDSGSKALLRYGLALQLRRGRPLQLGVDRRDHLARALHVAGTLAARERRIDFDRRIWAWWQEELAWMHAPIAKKRERRRQLRMPRKNQRVDFAAATRRARDGALVTVLPEIDQLLAA